jgi:FKBP-type peptidyl-prolyl cis-trans isomerase 2
MKRAGKNDSVKMHYTCTTDDGMVFSSKEQDKPLQFIVGKGDLLQPIEDGVIGMELNETKVINIPHQEAYGDVYKELIQEVDKELLPENVAVKVGLQLTSKQDDGSEIHFRITKVMENSVIVDGNHPLAGKDLEFEIELVEIA